MTLRGRITLGSTIVAILLLGMASAVVFAQLSVVVAEKERAVLHGITEVYRGVIQSDPTPRFDAPGPKQHVAIVAPAGDERMNTLPAPLEDRVERIIDLGPRLHHFPTKTATFTVYVDPVETPQGTWYVIATRDTDLAEEVLDDVAHLLIAVLVSAAVVFAVGSWVVAGAALRPVELMRRSAQSLVVARKGELLPTGPAKDELGALARTLNDLLERMRAAAERERQMVSDASHELRNPLAVLQAQLELVEGVDPAADAAVVDDARRTLARLTRIADSLLQLSRIDAAGEPQTMTLDDAAGVLAESVDAARLRASELREDRGVDIDFQIDIAERAHSIRLGADDLGRIVDNLLDNALAAATGDVEIGVALRQQGPTAVLTVSDDAGGFDPATAERAFERFVRGSGRASSGGGLGLAIVSRLASHAGGSAQIENHPGIGASIVVTLPVSEADTARDAGARPSPNTHHR
ncbi:hypothetical protein AB663_002436 [Microbacterium sp. XT11]|nr:hypothetical protein AB663_002436 [Microbacterium sp. XT11]